MTESIDNIIETLLFIGKYELGATSKMLDDKGFIDSANELNSKGYLQKIENGYDWYEITSEGREFYESLTNVAKEYYHKK